MHLGLVICAASVSLANLPLTWGMLRAPGCSNSTYSNANGPEGSSNVQDCIFERGYN